MATKTQLSELNQVRAELDEALEDISNVKELLSNAYTPEASRADLVTAVSEALDVLEDYDDDDDDEAEPSKADDDE